MESYRLTRFLQDQTIGPEVVHGYYIYTWVCDGRTVYVGMGKNRRAWNEHLNPMEGVRQTSITFKVRILRHRLTKKMAHSQERYYIRKFIEQGCPLLNRKVPNADSVKKCKRSNYHQSERSGAN